MKKIGIVVAIEINSVLKRFGEPKQKEKIGFFEKYVYKKDGTEFVCVHTGPGEIAAAAATQYLISVCGCELIVNFGIVGGLTDEMKVSKTCVAKRVVHYDYDTTAIDKDYVKGQYNEYSDAYIPATENLVRLANSINPELKEVTIASGDKFVASTKQKNSLASEFGADVCDMESAGVALTCNRNNIPYLIVKCVSDGLENSKIDYQTNFEAAADKCFETCEKILQIIK